MTTFSGPPSQATRNLAVSSELQGVLEAAAIVAGVDAVRITSGGQPARGEGTRRTGSTRHDHGRAADLQLVVNGTTQTFTDTTAMPVVAAFVTAAAARGATGIGAGVNYMGNKTIHVGFGLSPSDDTHLTWGAEGRAANAPQWLRNAAAAGWNAPASAVVAMARVAGRHVVIARNGLKLRMGPGTAFESPRTLAVGTELTVVAFEGENHSWARVDLEDDGMLDGHVFAAFLAPAAAANSEDAAEPDGT